MKWRNSVFYLLVLVLVGGYFYYFEVLKKEEKEAAEKKSKQLFHFKADQVHALEVYPKDKSPVVMIKDGQWKITEPVPTDADKGASESIADALANLEAEREVIGSTDDLKPFGLQQPSLKVRFQVGEDWSELLVGDKNPVGGGYYAGTGGDKRVVLIAEGHWGILNKGLDELRRRELFTFRPDEVKGIAVTWRDGRSVTVERQEDEKSWKTPDNPELEVKSGKVENLLEQVHWLRAQGFLENELKNLESHGLKPPFAAIGMKIEGDRSAELLLSDKQSGKQQISALSSELPFVVEVNADILDDLPKAAGDLEERSLIGIKTDEVKGIEWHLGEARGDVIRSEKNEWNFRKDDSEPKSLKDSWHVSTLLLDLKEVEFQKKISPPPTMPAQPHARVEFRDSEKDLVSLTWERLSENDSEPAMVWIERKGKLDAVQVEPQAIRKLEEDLNRIIQ